MATINGTDLVTLCVTGVRWRQSPTAAGQFPPLLRSRNVLNLREEPMHQPEIALGDGRRLWPELYCGLRHREEAAMATTVTLTVQGILDALDSSSGVLPIDALEQAIARWDEV